MAIARRVVFAQGKGGVGKTSIACNFAGLVAAAGTRVLVVDLDPQGNVARDLGMETSSGEALVMAAMAGSTPPVVKDVRPGLDVVPGGSAVADLSAIALSRSSRESGSLDETLGKMLAAVADDYDLIVIDTPPGERLLVEAAFKCASVVVIPTRADDGSLDGLARVAERFVEARRTNPDLSLAGVVLFAIGARSRRLERRVRDSVEGIVGTAAPVFASSIRNAEAAAYDARHVGKLIHELEGAAVEARRERLASLKAGERPVDGLLTRNATSLADDYENLARELLQRIVELEAEGAAA